MGHLGKNFQPSWALKTPPSFAKISQNQPQEPPQRRLEIVRCAKTAPRCLKMPPRRPKTPPRRAKPQEITHQDHQKTPTRPPQGPPEILINWRGGTKAKPSSIRRRSAERRARRLAVQLLASIHPAIHLRTSNWPIFQALGNLTAYIPCP